MFWVRAGVITMWGSAWIIGEFALYYLLTIRPPASQQLVRVQIIGWLVWTRREYGKSGKRSGISPAYNWSITVNPEPQSLKIKSQKSEFKMLDNGCVKAPEYHICAGRTCNAATAEWFVMAYWDLTIVCISGFLHSHTPWPHCLPLRDTKSDWQRIVWTSSESVWPQNSSTCSSENGSEWEKISSPSTRGNSNIRTS